MTREYKMPVCGIVIKDPPGGDPWIESDLKDKCEHCGRVVCQINCPVTIEDPKQLSRWIYNTLIGGVEIMILTAFDEGVDVMDPGFYCAIEQAMEECRKIAYEGGERDKTTLCQEST